jgi:hypothetical protein
VAAALSSNSAKAAATVGKPCIYIGSVGMVHSLPVSRQTDEYVSSVSWATCSSLHSIGIAWSFERMKVNSIRNKWCFHLKWLPWSQPFSMTGFAYVRASRPSSESLGRSARVLLVCCSCIALETVLVLQSCHVGIVLPQRLSLLASKISKWASYKLWNPGLASV